MSQNIFDTIIPSTTSGNQLATILNDLKDALMTGQSGTVRPSQTKKGGNWVDTSLEVSNNVLIYKFYDGSQDIEVFRINKLTGKAVIGSAQGTFEISKSSDDAVGPVLKFLKKRATGTGQTLSGDIVGDQDFYGTRDDSIEEIQARIRVTSTDNVTSTTQGSRISFSTTKTGSPNLVEKMVITNDGKLGVGATVPLKTIHSVGTDSSAGHTAEALGDFVSGPKMVLKKRRLAGSGQVLLNDEIGTYEFKSVTNTGVEVVVAKIETIATENHTDTAQGVKLKISTKKDGTATFQDAIVIENNKVTILGQDASVDIKSKLTLEDKSVVRNLFSVDGSVHGSFEITANAIGRDNVVETRAQIIKIKGVYDSVASQWFVSQDSSIINDNGQPLVNIDIPSLAVQNLSVNYLNQFDDLNFVSGTIYLDIRRNKI